MVTPEQAALAADRRRRAAAGPLAIPKAQTHKGDLLDLIVDAATRGAGWTDDELCKMTGVPYRTLGVPRRALRKEGWIVDAGERRPSERNQPAIIWLLSETGAVQFNLAKGWKEKRSVRRKAAAPKDLSPEERRQRAEREAIKRASTPSIDAQFRRDVDRWRQWTGYMIDLADRAEAHPVAPLEQEALIMLMEHFHFQTGRALENLRRNSAKPVDLRYYQLLGVPYDAAGEFIKTAYRDLARKYHPDATGGDPDKEAKFKDISKAYDVLSDPERRRRYNAYGLAMK